mmetsp:Transcript_74690/g.147966  ORF Transcript_74690/g.147966 Transcript_74690/m.147966 type:complete len:359 (-) Transcript_74690:178-1254(-)
MLSPIHSQTRSTCSDDSFDFHHVFCGSAGCSDKELDDAGFVECFGAANTAWGGSHDEAAAVADIIAWLKSSPSQKEWDEEMRISSAKPENMAALQLSVQVAAANLFQSTMRYVEYHVPAECIVIDDASMRIEAKVYADFIPLNVVIRVRPTQLGSSSEASSEASFSNLCGRDVVSFHHLFSHAARFLEEATASSHVRTPSQLVFLDFESEGEDEDGEDSTVASTIHEDVLEPFIANLSSHWRCEREEAVSVLASAASSSPGCRNLLNALIARQPVLSALQRLLHPENMANEMVCLEATRYPVLALVVSLAKGHHMDVQVARALHSMLAELDLGRCSVPVRAELTSALDSLWHTVAQQD